MRPLIIATLTIIGCGGVGATQPQPEFPRFSGSGSIIAPITESADQRFLISAKLRANHTQSNDRFVVNARMMPDAKSATVACGPLGDEVFSDGFEGT